ncbi:hypothetical protein BOTBODRAFT_28883 [Botryobasidium botryosum FD-172 SS1]|uniref:Anaphase-promoting complex subunit 5 n=1 Tax=Botryobasidium botryosum (strain FD-172 SS1) TaxID=930990 RepID=A0A067N411_BOTB1|nr:hypothetical protein BOTBODRAFT_28883 [Botryobasidium botryosum FD-172 SS1]
MAEPDLLEPPPPPPPKTHVLRPHHVGILAVFIFAYKEIFSPPFTMHIMRILAREIAETQKPTPYPVLVDMISEGPWANTEARRICRTLRTIPEYVGGADILGDFFNDVQWLFLPKPEIHGQPKQPPPPLDRHSYFGLFARRWRLEYAKLSFSGVLKLQRDFVKWCAGDVTAGYDIKQTDRGGGLLIFPGISDEKQYAQAEAYERYQQAAAIGDTQSAIENLRRFFDQHFSEKDDSGLHQLALLNLATLHYSLGEFVASRQALDEAIKVARAGSDRETLQHCLSLLRRISPAQGPSSEPRANVNTIQSGTSPLDVLWDVKRLMDLGEPLRVGFAELYESIGCQQVGTPLRTNRWAKNAVAATLWRMAGVESLAKAHEGLVILFTEPGDDDSRLTMVCSRARHLVRQGDVNTALAVLLHSDTWRGLNLRQYSTWAGEVWHSLMWTAMQRGQEVMVRDFLMPRRPSDRPPPQAPGTVYGTRSSATTALNAARTFRDAKQVVPAIGPLMEGIWITEFRGLYGLHRTAVVMLADVGIELGMAKSAAKSIEECLPQLLNGDDLEQRAFACLTLARCRIAAASADGKPQTKELRDALESALPFLIIAERDYAKIQKYAARLEVLYLASVVYHNLGMYPERNRTAELHRAEEAKREVVSRAEVDDEIKDVLDFVVDVAKVIGKR